MTARRPTGAVFSSLRNYRMAYLRPDVVAGLTVWAVLVPEALAYATIAGVPAVVGLYAAVPALVLYAAAGSSRHLVVGPMSATAALSAATVGPIAGDDPQLFLATTVALSITAGLVALLAGVLRMGFIASFISEPVLKGFIVGLALTIIIGQVPKLFGVPKGAGNFFEQAGSFLTHLSEWNWRTTIIGVTSLVLVLTIRRWLPLVPGSLVAVLGGIGAVWLLGLDDSGVDIVGQIDPGLPELGLPSGMSMDQYLELVGPAAGIVLIGFAEGLGAAKTYAARAGYTVDANRELIGLGAANVGSGLCSGMVVNGSLSKTAVNGGAGAKTQASGLVVAVLTVLTLMFLTGLFEKLPEATLAAVVIAAVVELVDLAALRRLYRVWTGRLGTIYGRAARADFIAALVALFGVLVFDTLPGLIIGIAASMLLLLYRVSRPHVATVVKDGTRWVEATDEADPRHVEGVTVIRVEAGLFFANADTVRDRISDLATGDARAIVLDAETSPFIDVSAVSMLVELHDALSGRGIQFAIAREVGQFRDVIGTAAPDSALQVFPTVAEALTAQARGRPGPATPPDPNDP
ncbi:SulP family inorganic anion transporter [Gordonia terrae]|uniref:SulP family inorganic anion transporter n=1 Tax=Gordonia terrae TaxID=2055 RepID=UPI0005525969|nr:SulP family inorganic anion transporter [Gordonia terrae]